MGLSRLHGVIIRHALPMGAYLLSTPAVALGNRSAAGRSVVSGIVVLRRARRLSTDLQRI
jgi:hypothetical protein